MTALGIGGLFFRASDPDQLSLWYREHLGVGGGCAAPGAPDAPNAYVWQTLGGPTVFAPFKADTDYWPADRAFMLNLRVADLDVLLDRFRASGLAVETRPEWDDPQTGRFARVVDPEGNPIELWQAPAEQS